GLLGLEVRTADVLRSVPQVADRRVHDGERPAGELQGSAVEVSDLVDAEGEDEVVPVPDEIGERRQRALPGPRRNRLGRDAEFAYGPPQAHDHAVLIGIADRRALEDEADGLVWRGAG